MKSKVEVKSEAEVKGNEKVERGSMILSGGAVRATFTGLDLRNVTIHGVEIAQRIYTAVRDPIWGTVGAVSENTSNSPLEGNSTVNFTTRCTDDEIDYRQETTYLASAEDDMLRCRLEGMALRDFQYNRIGFCVLLDKSVAGCRYRMWRSDGKVEDGILSQLVAPQPEIAGNLYPYLGPFVAFQLELQGGGVVKYGFSGDVFELEDQRNWTDSSFKIYSTPLEAGWPLQATSGDTFTQTLDVSFQSASLLRRRRVKRARRDRMALTLGPVSHRSLPRLGSNLGSVAEISQSQKELLRELRLDHLRIERNFSRDIEAVDASNAALCRELNTAAEVVIELPDHADADTGQSIGSVGDLINGLVVDRVIVLQSGVPCTGGEVARRVRSELVARGQEIPCYGGTNLHFADINRYRPNMEGADGVAFPIVPTVHADDDETVLDNIRAQADVVLSASALCGGRPLAIGPITLRPRFSAWAGDNDIRSGAGPNDARQWSSFGAFWTLKSLRVLADAGVNSVTYHDVVGYQGLLAPTKGEAGIPEIYPVYWLLRWLGEWKGAQMVSCPLPEGSPVTCLGLRRGTETRIILGNGAEEPSPIEIPGGRQAVIRTIDSGGVIRTADRNDGVIELGRYQVACADLRG